VTGLLSENEVKIVSNTRTDTGALRRGFGLAPTYGQHMLWFPEHSLKAVPQKAKTGSGGFGFFDEGFLADDDDDAGFRDMEAPAVGFQVITDLRVLRQADVPINDGTANA
jgi:hypothetical protein